MMRSASALAPRAALAVFATGWSACVLGHRDSAPRIDIATIAEKETGKALAPMTDAERLSALKHAFVFDDVAVARRDILVGPSNPYGFTFLQPIVCHFDEPKVGAHPVTGTTPKFFCDYKRAKVRLKIKYAVRDPANLDGEMNDREIIGEVLASRLFWALGVAADHVYPVRVRCEGCPANPWEVVRSGDRSAGGPRGAHEFPDAIVQRLYPALPIESCLRIEDGQCAERRLEEGWLFDDLELVDEHEGGASKAELDAFRLLAAFIAHGDDKHDNHRLVCPLDALDAQGKCKRARLMIGDLGATFAQGSSSIGLVDQASVVRWKEWSAQPLWQDPAACRVYWRTRKGKRHPIISEAGRAFLAARIGALTDRQIRDLFTVAQVEKTREKARIDGRERLVGIDDWIATFRARRAEIVDHHCPR